MLNMAGFSFETCPCFFMVSVLNFFGIDKSIAIGFGKFWYRKKYKYQFRKKLVLKEVSVSEKIWYRKKYRFWNRKNWYRKKVSDSVSFRFLISSHTG